jgi:acyl carrier protein
MMGKPEVLDALKEVLVDRMKVEPEKVTPEADLFDDLGLDSLDLMTTVMVIEEQFGIEVSDDELEPVTTIGQAVELLAGKMPVGA